MFPEDVHLNILSFLGTCPRKRCWCQTNQYKRCKKNVRNKNFCIFCPIHEIARFKLPLYKPYEDIAYLIEKIGQKKQSYPREQHSPPRHRSGKRCRSHHRRKCSICSRSPQNIVHQMEIRSHFPFV